ncbi:unnamed protein product [Miscanthus lutarioriparius]|uniref:Uncharacterized protein n=1 Tax=Miscanthus lutarioriparius TaxID=422564 RepID=A0A811RAD5_9POAL|nr:unnamed protein product [Miscanthus lutarioriparius]
MDTAARRRGVLPLLVTGLLLALAPMAARSRGPSAGAPATTTRPTAPTSPTSHSSPRRSPRTRPGRGTSSPRAASAPSRTSSTLWPSASSCGDCVTTDHGVQGRAAAVPLLQGRDGAVRPLLPALLQPELPHLHQQRQPHHAQKHPERKLAGASFRGRSRRASQRHRRLRGGELVQEVRYGVGGLRHQQPHHLRAHAVHAGHFARRLPELPWEHNRDGAAVQREPGREGHRIAVQFQVFSCIHLNTSGPAPGGDRQLTGALGDPPRPRDLGAGEGVDRHPGAGARSPGGAPTSLHEGFPLWLGLRRPVPRFRDRDDKHGGAERPVVELRAAQERWCKRDREIRAWEKKIRESARRRRAHRDAGLPSDEDEEDEEDGEDENERGSEGMPVLDFPFNHKLSRDPLVALPNPLPPTFDNGEVGIGSEGGGSAAQAWDRASQKWAADDSGAETSMRHVWSHTNRGVDRPSSCSDGRYSGRSRSPAGQGRDSGAPKQLPPAPPGAPPRTAWRLVSHPSSDGRSSSEGGDRQPVVNEAPDAGGSSVPAQRPSADAPRSAMEIVPAGAAIAPPPLASEDAAAVAPLPRSEATVAALPPQEPRDATAASQPVLEREGRTGSPHIGQGPGNNAEKRRGSWRGQGRSCAKGLPCLLGGRGVRMPCMVTPVRCGPLTHGLACSAACPVPSANPMAVNGMEAAADVRTGDEWVVLNPFPGSWYSDCDTALKE